MKRPPRHVDNFPCKYDKLLVKEWRKIMTQAKTPKEFKAAKDKICTIWGIRKSYLTRLLAEEE